MNLLQPCVCPSCGASLNFFMDATVCPRCKRLLKTRPIGNPLTADIRLLAYKGWSRLQRAFKSAPVVQAGMVCIGKTEPVVTPMSSPSASAIAPIQPEQKNWFYLVGSTPFGPVTTAELQRALLAGELGQAVYVFRQGLEGWQHAKDCAELFPPPPPISEGTQVAEQPAQIIPAPPVRVLVKAQEEVRGPYTFAQLKDEIAAKRISLSDDGQMEGAAEWVPLKDIPEVLDNVLPPPTEVYAGGSATDRVSNSVADCPSPRISLPEPSSPFAPVHYATLDIRILAGLIDFLILLVPCIVVRKVYFTTLVGWIYESVFTSSSWQATPGMKVVRIQLTDLYGKRISFLRASGRYLATFLSSCLMFGGFIMIPFTVKRQGLHDILAGTVVPKIPKRSPSSTTPA
jgi:uncharacterized RDD family membrane protein YckC